MRLQLLWLLLVVLCLHSSSSYPLRLRRLARKFLKNFGYSKNEILDQNSPACKEALSKAQAFAHLRTTGVLDHETEDLMRIPRCQHHDVNLENDFIGSKEFEKFQKIFKKKKEKKKKSCSKISQKLKTLLWKNPWARRSNHKRMWRRRWNGLRKRVRQNRYKRYFIVGMFSEPSLSYSILNYPTNTINLTNEQVDETVKWAFDSWLKHAPGLKISQMATGKNDTDLIVSFVTGDHNDSHPFDGSGGVVGHAFFPTRGEVHLDDDEKWSRGTTEGINLQWVLLHEIGHSLGLGHSMNSKAVMYPYYSEFKDKLVLGDDDITGISEIYST